MAAPLGNKNNPNGRPPKNRALTEILEKAGATSLDISGKKVSGKRLLASLLWEAATTGRVTFRPAEDDQEAEGYVLKPEEWIGVAKFIYTQVDGPPKQSVEVGGPNGGPMRHEVKQVFDHANVVAAIAGRPTADSETPSTD